MTDPDLTAPEAVERYEAARRIDRALNTPSSALREIRELKARAETLDAKLKEAVALLRGSDAAFERLGYAPESIARESINAFLGSLAGNKTDE